MTTAESSAPVTIPVERRFPLDLESRDGGIRILYQAAKQDHWDPERGVPWDSLDPARIPHADRESARRVWSRRAWLEYTGLAETPALLIRFCLETGRESEPKFFLTVRNTEEAWHVECCHRIAECLGGYLDRPADPAREELFNQTLYREALDAAASLDAFVATHCAFEDGLEAELAAAWLGTAREPAVRSLLEHMQRAKRRHADFGWRYLAQRAPALEPAARHAVEGQLVRWIQTVELAGYHCVSLATGFDPAAESADLDRCAAAGLGAVPAAAEEAVFRATLAAARARLAALGLALPAFHHPRLGAV